MTRRTQLRAQLDLGSDHLRVMWVVTEPGPLVELIDDAMPELTDLLVERMVQVAGPPRWISLYGEDGVWLRADLRVRAWRSTAVRS